MEKLLIVEDERPLLNKMVDNINWKDHGYRVFGAAQGDRALSIIREMTIDILVTDIKMPGMSGIELIKRCRACNQQIIPVIISGYAEFEYARQSLRLDVADYLLKPFRSFKLLEVVDRAREILWEEQNRQQQLLELREELEELLEQKRGLTTHFDQEKLYKKQAVILNNSQLFQDLRQGSRQDLLEDIELLVERLGSLEEEDVLIILNNLILLTFKNLREMGYELKDVIDNIGSEVLNCGEINNDPGQLQNFLQGFLLEVNKYISCQEDKQSIQIIKQAVARINEDFTAGITLSGLAQELNVSNSYLSQMFQKHTGRKFSKYLDDLRLNRARELLKTTDDRIYTISNKVGFEDPYYFSSWFKERIGVSPTTYRDNLSLF